MLPPGDPSMTMRPNMVPGYQLPMGQSPPQLPLPGQAPPSGAPGPMTMPGGAPMQGGPPMNGFQGLPPQLQAIISQLPPQAQALLAQLPPQAVMAVLAHVLGGSIGQVPAGPSNPGGLGPTPPPGFGGAPPSMMPSSGGPIPPAALGTPTMNGIPAGMQMSPGYFSPYGLQGPNGPYGLSGPAVALAAATGQPITDATLNARG